VDQGERQASLHADVLVASVPTLGRASSNRLRAYDPARFKCIVIDEVAARAEERRAHTCAWPPALPCGWHWSDSQTNVCIYVYVCMYGCMYVCLYVSTDKLGS
jgi:hypothetical protein